MHQQEGSQLVDEFLEEEKTMTKDELQNFMHQGSQPYRDAVSKEQLPPMTDT